MIHIQNLTFGYRKNHPLYRNLNLKLEDGNIYGLLGKNGAGKSTLLKNLIGLLFPVSGSISVNGHNPQKRTPGFLKSIYFIPEEVYVPALTIKRYVNLNSPFYPDFDKELFNKYLSLLEVATNEKLTTLSFGQQKKFIIAFGLACNTDILLLDEPTNGLDIPSKTQFRKLISLGLTEKRMIFISTHQIRDLDNLIDRVIIIDQGELLLNASLTEIGENLSFKSIKELPQDTDQVLYSEDSLNGYSVVMRNTNGDDSKVNLEHLFNAVTFNPHLAKAIFNQNQ